MNEVTQQRYLELAPASAGAGAIEKVKDAGRAAEEAVVMRDTAAET